MNTIPKNLEECFVALESIVAFPAELEIFISCRKEELIKYHRGLGLWIRNNWNLWDSSSELKTFLTTQGLKHPDDMSQFIIEKFWEYLHNKNESAPPATNGMSEIIATKIIRIHGSFTAVKDILDKLDPNLSAKFTTNCVCCNPQEDIEVKCGMDASGNYKFIGFQTSCLKSGGGLMVSPPLVKVSK